MLIQKGQVSATAHVKNSRRYVGRLLETARRLYTFPMVFQAGVLNYLQGEPRIIISDDGQEEAYSLVAACTLLAPLLKQGRYRKNRALDIKVCTWRAICHRILVDAGIVTAAAVCRND